MENCPDESKGKTRRVCDERSSATEWYGAGAQAVKPPVIMSALNPCPVYRHVALSLSPPSSVRVWPPRHMMMMMMMTMKSGHRCVRAHQLSAASVRLSPVRVSVDHCIVLKIYSGSLF